MQRLDTTPRMKTGNYLFAKDYIHKKTSLRDGEGGKWTWKGCGNSPIRHVSIPCRKTEYLYKSRTGSSRAGTPRYSGVSYIYIRRRERRIPRSIRGGKKDRGVGNDEPSAVQTRHRHVKEMAFLPCSTSPMLRCTFSNLMKWHVSLSRWLNRPASETNSFAHFFEFGQWYTFCLCTGEFKCLFKHSAVSNSLWQM